MLTCVDCGAAFTRLSASGRPRIRCYDCSPQKRATTTPRPCRWCGEMLGVLGTQLRYCSAVCRNRAAEERRKIPCSDCGAPMWASRTTAAIPRCLSCRRSAPSYQPAGWRATPELRECVICLTSFEAVGIQTYCSATCRQDARNIRRREQGDPIATTQLVVGALASRHGVMAWAPTMVRCERWAGVAAFCPECRDVLGCATQDVRACPSCATEVRLNAEELALA